MHPFFNPPSRVMQIAAALFPLVSFTAAARADIFQWEYINPNNPAEGKQQSTTLAPDGAGVDAVPGVDLSSRNLTMAYLIGADLRDTSFYRATLTDADFTGAEVRAARFDVGLFCIPSVICGPKIGTGISPTQLYSTASYQAHELSGIGLVFNELSGANFAGQNLTDSSFGWATLTEADFTGAIIQGASFSKVLSDERRFGTGITIAQLYSTASYQARDLRGIDLSANDLAGANLAGQNLTNASLVAATLTGADLTGADMTGVEVRDARLDLTSGFTATQLYSTASYQARALGGIWLPSKDLSGWNLAGQSLFRARLWAANLSSADLSQASLVGAWLGGADLTGAEIRGANFGIESQQSTGQGSGITDVQIYSTASYQAHDLAGIGLTRNDLTGANFAGQNLTSASFFHATLTGATFREANLANANFLGAMLTNADFTGAKVRGANFAVGHVCNFNGCFISDGLTLAQLYSTASHQEGDLRGVTGVDLSAATTTSIIMPGGQIDGLDLDSGGLLVVRDYEDPRYNPALVIPITVDQHLTMGPGGTLRMVFEADAWDSTISFAPGIPVTLGGTLELTFAADVNLATQLGRSFRVFNWSGVSLTGAFAVSSPYAWNLSNLYTTGEVTLTAVPEPLTLVLLSLALISLFQLRPSRASRDRQLFSRPYLLLMLLLFGVLPNSADAQVKVFILAGQSNAVGFAGNANNLPASLREPFEDVLFWYDIGMPNGRAANDTHVRPVEGTSTWVPLRPQEEFGGRVAFDKPNFGFTGQNITTGHGAELTLGRELAGRLSDQIAILKFAWNGTPLSSTSGQQDWNVSSQGEYYDSLVAETSTALSHLQTDLGKSGEIAGIFWMQGESDAYAGSAELYEENLQALVDAARDEWGESLPVVIAQAHKDGVNWVHPVGIDEPYLSEIRAAQQSVATKSQFVRTVDLDDIPLTSDSVHFDSMGLQVVGKRLADAYLAIVPEPPPGDFNLDGIVDAADYVVWRKGLGTTYTQADYDIWRTSFGKTGGIGAAPSSAEPLSAAAPEPPTVLVCLMAMVVIRFRRAALVNPITDQSHQESTVQDLS